MHLDKAPGPDDFNLGFYQSYWDVVGDDVFHFVLNAMNDCELPVDVHCTNIVLIPKMKNSK